MKNVIKNSMMLGVLFLGATSTTSASSRWFSEDQITQGKQLFGEHCQSCHGEKAQGTINWKQTDKDGKYPPPPLNGNAHTWHHSMDILRRTIREGGVALGGSMPSFKEKLNDKQTDAVISYFQSQWSDKTYQGWAARHLPKKQVTVVKPKTQQDKPNPADKASPITSLLRKMIAGASIGDPEKTPLSSMYQVKLGNDYVYLTKDGRYLFSGNMIDLKSQKNLTREAKTKDTLALLNDFAEDNKIIFKAKGKEETAINVFTDTSCPYCRKIHREVPELQKAGVTVKYIAFPRSGLQGEAYQTMKSVWCAEDKQKALKIAKGNKPTKLDQTDCDASKAVDAGYQLGKRIGITGTPAIVLPSGELIGGYMHYKRLLRSLKINTK